MNRDRYRKRLLFAIILIEGYVVLACELLAVRQLIPFVGSGVEVVSIIISAVLLPLAAGYHFGGHAYRRSYLWSKGGPGAGVSVRRILLKNITFSLIILTLGLSYLSLEIWFFGMQTLGITGRLLQTFLYSLCFLVIPVFLLGQTVPLVSHYLPKGRLSETTGNMLFFSTVGSFLGAVFSTIVLMNTIGVHNTVIVTLGLLTILGILLCRKKRCYFLLFPVFIAGVMLNGDYAMKRKHIVSDDAYNIVRAVDDVENNMRILNINSAISALISRDLKVHFGYMDYIEKNFISPMSHPNDKARDILVIGAGGFTLGLDDNVNRYTFVDIDGALKEVAEKQFLRKALSPNKQFIISSARAYVRNGAKKYDLVVLDVYTHMESIPMECVTRDFLMDIKSLLKEGGVVVANIISSPDFRDSFSVRYDNTFSSVFPVHTRQVLNEFNPWAAASSPAANVLYIYYNNRFTHDRGIYTDDKNTYSLDRP